MTQKIQMTREGYERLERALEHERQRRDEATASMAAVLDDAIDLEDRSLQAAQHDFAGMDARIMELEDALVRAEIVDTVDDADGHVRIGSVVDLHDNTQNRDVRVQLVSAVETTLLDEGITHVSDDSPVGKALLGRQRGDTFTVDLGDRQKDYTVQNVEHR
ncbi:GreA/GreB family elongation factor [Deinococcus maricopensis]|uniref:GreA/GreB family elongation factor n=1 Tax=Deinococcus maricopensis (strain DSM 21211 / LMG 22137 / NRRL B-23946 / LB-34) TaxID=709986 RepID=E8U971_DEIML|nr:GreA/GreB family elongation factor [Deinococcus maricopensis]ADV67610.1 GreA/GreB family elongation factor [Deinococcus maricopensis DSM 21211]